jgi:pyruvate/2-oxoglutarate dehydrogenase complex dihydrolipoamide acyltransferase (E2) component
LLGGLLAKFLGNRGGAPAGAPAAPSVTPIVTAEPSATFAPAATPKSRKAAESPPPRPSTTPSSAPSVRPSALRAATSQPSVIFITPVPTATAQQSVAPALPPAATPKAGPPLETPSPAGAAGSDRASAVVHSYLAALARGDESSAASYLMSGLPTEKFMTPGSRITSVNSAKNSDGSYKVTADVQTPNGEYFETFTVENGPSGLQISDHYAIKP